MRKHAIWLVTILLLTGNVHPAAAFNVTSRFGWRVHPVTGKTQFHSGIDISSRLGTPIHAVLAGEVLWAACRNGYGNTVLLHHPNGTCTLYGHCRRILVRPGQQVKAGTVIATVGNSGVSTGPHLHLEYWVNHKYVNPMVLWKNPVITASGQVAQQ